MQEITLQSCAKINLSLSVLGRRPDGYHTIQSLMQTVDFGDTLTVALREEPGIFIETNVTDLPTDEGNIAWRAAVLMQETFALSRGILIRIHKRIPVAAGLAGGSGNAAAVLKAVNKLCELNVSEEQLAALGLKLGADVPFCLYGRPAMAEGIGEEIQPAVGLSGCHVVLVNPGVGVSTALIYKALDSGELPPGGNKERLLRALSEGRLTDAFCDMINVMEPVAIQYCPAISGLIEGLYSAGAQHAMMSGSGATCFGIFTKEPDAEKLQQIFGEKLVAITKPIL